MTKRTEYRTRLIFDIKEAIGHENAADYDIDGIIADGYVWETDAVNNERSGWVPTYDGEAEFWKIVAANEISSKS